MGFKKEVGLIVFIISSQKWINKSYTYGRFIMFSKVRKDMINKIINGCLKKMNKISDLQR